MGGEAAIRGGPSTRVTLVSEINEAFNRLNIQATAQKLARVAAAGDFLDITHELGILDPIHGGDLAKYKQDLDIPAASQALLTTAFQQALTAKPPIPLQIMIASGTHDIVTVTSTATEITVMITRDDTP